MTTHAAQFVLVLVLAVAGGCGFVRPTGPPRAPAENEAVVVFVGRATGALLYDVSDGDDERFIGISDPETKVGYVCPAGTRRFMVVGETADFLDASLAPGKTYYALVTQRPGWM